MSSRPVFSLSGRYAALSAAGDPLERLPTRAATVLYRPLIAALRRGRRRNAGRPPYYPVQMFKMLVLEGQYSLPDEATEIPIKEPLLFQAAPGP